MQPSSIRPWPHRAACLPSYEWLMHKFDGASPNGYSVDIVSWEGFGYELRMIRPHTPHVFTERLALQEPEDKAWEVVSGPIRFDFSDPRDAVLNMKALKSDNAILSLVVHVPEFNIGYIRNLAAHRLYYIVEGQAQFDTEIGILSAPAQTFVFIPKGLTYTWHALTERVVLLSLESRNILFPPFVAGCGSFFPFDFAALTLPNPALWENDQKEYRILEKDASGRPWAIKVPVHPLNTVAWSGFLYPFALSTSDVKTISSHNFHLSPDLLTTFTTEDQSLKIAAFLPRVLHSLPFPHRNIDYDEFVFYLAPYSGRSVKKGEATLHPRGFHHGPEPNARERRPDLWSGIVPNLKDRWTEERAIMVESKSPILVNQEALDKFLVPYHGQKK